MVLCSISAVSWGLTITSVLYEVPVTNALYFILTDVVLGILCPLLVAFSIIVLAAVMQFVTSNKVKVKGIAPIFLSSLTYRQGERFGYWVIIDTFYFRVKKVRDSDHKSSGVSLPRSPSTWCIFTIITLTLAMVVSVFVSETVSEKTHYSTCQDAVNSGEMSCFVQPSYSPINCSEASSLEETNVVCFQFLLTGVSSDPVQALVISLFLYMTCDKLLLVLFRLMKGLVSFKKTVWWAIIVLGAGVALIILEIIQFSVSISLAGNFDLLNMFKYFVLSCDILLAGVLLLIGSPMEKIDKKLSEQNSELHLQYVSDQDTLSQN